LLLLSGLVLVVASFFVGQKETVDIHVHDTYYVIAQGHVLLLFAFIVWVLWFLYLLTRKALYSKSLTWTHVAITLLAILVLIFVLYFNSDTFPARPRRYLDFSGWTSYGQFSRNMRVIAFSIFGLLLGQITFLINLVLGLFKRFT